MTNMGFRARNGEGEEAERLRRASAARCFMLCRI